MLRLIVFSPGKTSVFCSTRIQTTHTGTMKSSAAGGPRGRGKWAVASQVTPFTSFWCWATDARPDRSWSGRSRPSSSARAAHDARPARLAQGNGSGVELAFPAADPRRSCPRAADALGVRGVGVVPLPGPGDGAVASAYSEIDTCPAGRRSLPSGRGTLGAGRRPVAVGDLAVDRACRQHGEQNC
jgi:hypothetical protein